MSAANPAPTARATPSAAIGVYAALSLADTYLAGQRCERRRRWRVLTKPLLMPSLMAAFASATVARAPGADRGRARLTRTGALVAQSLSGGGDVALLSKTEAAFLTGVGSFLGAHVAYTATFLANGRRLSDPTDRGATLATLGAAGSLAPFVAWASGRRAPRLRAPVAAYAAMITAMVVSSTRLDDHVPLQAQRAIRAGTALFLVSDTVIAARKFVVNAPRPWSDGVVMATYTAGQGLIALGLAQVVGAPRPADAAPPARVEETDG